MTSTVRRRPDGSSPPNRTRTSVSETSGIAFVPLRCIGVRTETPTIRTFSFEPADGGTFPYAAGQALTLGVDLDGETLLRTFSISSAPQRGAPIEITVKAHPHGRVTQFLHRRLVVGSLARARQARGHFTLDKRSGDKLAFISAGSGATPLMSMLRAMDAGGEVIDAAWFHSATEPDEVLFAGEFAGLQRRHPRLSVAVTLSRPAPGWFGYRGRLTRRMLSIAIPDLGQRDVFCCGPAGFMDEARLIHAAEGGRRGRFHTESFGGATLAATLAASAGVPDTGITYELIVGPQTLSVKAGETILQAALRQRIAIPCGCGEGICGTCIVKKLSGDTTMAHQGGLSADEEHAGYVLACSTRLLSAVEIAL